MGSWNKIKSRAKDADDEMMEVLEASRLYGSAEADNRSQDACSKRRW